MEYPIALGILVVYFGIVGFLALRKGSPEPPPKGGVQDEQRQRVSFKEFYRARAVQREHDTILAQRRSA